eukprot:GEMP01049737.1.p1 GENE.GEMP01049737.1~~GEMP01049737.1.p1  ORF type:complete len:147 (+),score=38.66 GEMP01049737.1:613-1053(+)
MLPQDINVLFDTLREYPDVDFASPSFSHDSAGVWRYFDRQDTQCALRYTNFVECSAPVIATRMLVDPLFQACLRAANTGCFLDFCFGSLGTCAVVDTARCHHPERDSAMDTHVPRTQHQDDSARFAHLPRSIWWWRDPAVVNRIAR